MISVEDLAGVVPAAESAQVVWIAAAICSLLAVVAAAILGESPEAALRRHLAAALHHDERLVVVAAAGTVGAAAGGGPSKAAGRGGLQLAQLCSESLHLALVHDLHRRGRARLSAALAARPRRGAQRLAQLGLARGARPGGWCDMGTGSAELRGMAA